MDVDYMIEQLGTAYTSDIYRFEWAIYSLDDLPGRRLIHGFTATHNEALEEVRLALDNRPGWKLVITGE